MCLPLRAVGTSPQGDVWDGAAKTVIVGSDGGGGKQGPLTLLVGQLQVSPGNLFRNQACVCDL